MATTVFNVAKGKMADGSLDLDTTDVRTLLLKVAPAGAQDPDLATITALLAVSTTAECDFTNYARKGALAGRSVSVDNANDRAQVAASTQTWTAAGGASNNTIVAAVHYIEGATDTLRIPVSIDVFTGVTTNGSDFQYAYTNGIWRVT